MLVKHVYIISYLSYYSKKNVTNIDKEKKRNDTHHKTKKKKGENIINTVTYKDKSKIKLWIILIPMINLENRQTYIRKIRNQFIHKRIKGYVQKSKRNKTDAHSFLNRANHNNDTVL